MSKPVMKCEYMENGGVCSSFAGMTACISFDLKGVENGFCEHLKLVEVRLGIDS